MDIRLIQEYGQGPPDKKMKTVHKISPEEPGRSKPQFPALDIPLQTPQNVPFTVNLKGALKNLLWV